MKPKKESKEVTLKLHSFKSEVDRERGIFYGGVAEPKHLDELTIDIENDADFDPETEQFTESGMFSVDISGTARALLELGTFFINMALFQTEDEGYHEHLDQLRDRKGNPLANLTIRKRSGSKS